MSERLLIEPRQRHPVHVFYGGAQLFQRGVFEKLGHRALDLLQRYQPLGDSPLLPRIVKKLSTAAIEDYRIDFEDGYGARSDAEEDEDARRTGQEFARIAAAGELPFRIGLRPKAACGRARHTLEIFLREATAGPFPNLFVITQPKIACAEDVKLWREMLEQLERRCQLPGGTLAHELMIEHPGAVRHLGEIVRAAENRLHAGHFGAYDYLSALAVPFPAQHLDHPYASFARWEMLQVFTLLGKPVSDGAVTQLPVGQDPDGLREAWAIHQRQVRRALDEGFYCGWDLHPGQLISRYASLYAYFAEHVGAAQSRLQAFCDASARARVSGTQFDDAATVEGLRVFLSRAISCGAIDSSIDSSEAS